MQYTRLPLWLFAALLSAAACVNPPEYPDEPIIVFEQLNKNTIYQYNDQNNRPGPADSIVIKFSFTDGDGDLSNADGKADIFLRDSRFGDLAQIPVAFPLIPGEGTGNGISGDVSFTLLNIPQQICCVFNGRICVDDDRYPVDTLSYFIYIEDRAGNRSNTIQTEQIQILCDLDR